MNTSPRFLEDLRPAREAFDPDWSAETLAAIMSQPTVASGRTQPYPRRSRKRSAWLTAAAIIAGLMAVPTVLSSGGASARENLLALSTVAASRNEPAIAPGSFLHIKTVSLQKNSPALSDGKRLDTDREEWVRWDGAAWIIDTRPSAGWTEYNRFDPPKESSFGTPTPKFIAALPNTAAELRAYLDANVSGSGSHQEALFAAISGLVNSRMLDPKTFSVALDVLADVDGVTTSDVVVDGRYAVRVGFKRDLGSGEFARQSFTVDRKTAELLRTSETSPSSTYYSATKLVEVADEMPTSVLERFQLHANSVTVCSNGDAAKDTCS